MSFASNPYARVDAVFASGLDPSSRLVLLALDRVAMAGDGSTCSPSVAEVAKMTGLSCGTIHTALRRCLSVGAIRRAGIHRRRVRYALTFSSMAVDVGSTGRGSR